MLPTTIKLTGKYKGTLNVEWRKSGEYLFISLGTWNQTQRTHHHIVSGKEQFAVSMRLKIVPVAGKRLEFQQYESFCKKNFATFFSGPNSRKKLAEIAEIAIPKIEAIVAKESFIKDLTVMALKHDINACKSREKGFLDRAREVAKERTALEKQLAMASK